MEQYPFSDDIKKKDEAARVLVVDDNADNAFLLKVFLSKQGYQVIDATNGLEAIEQVIRAEPDIILMDLQMPYMDGYEATKRIKARATSKNIPIIAVSGHIAHQEATRLTESGFDAFVAKPVDLSSEGLIAKIKALLARTARVTSSIMQRAS
jgi:CheY-like chemotaxis protein